MIFSISYSYWLLVVIILIAIIATYFLYQNQKIQFSRNVFLALVTLRFLSLFSLLFLLLSPFLKYIKNKVEKPTNVCLQDNSASEKFAFKKMDSVAYKKNVIDLIESLKEDFYVKSYSFGATLNDTLSFDYSKSMTDIHQAISTTLTNFENQNVGAIILASDGIYNQGLSPVSEIYPFKGAFYTVGVGDTSIQKDAFVARVFANKFVYTGDRFAIRSDVTAYDCMNHSVNVQIFSHNQNRIVASQTIQIQSNRFSKSLETIIDANSVGVQHFTISVSKVEGEQNVFNNSQDIYVEVLDSKERILILANAPHPDVNAIKEALSKNKNYKIDLALGDKPIQKLDDYNLVILHNLPSVIFNTKTLIEQANRAGVSLWFIVGQQTAIPLLNQYQTALQITARGASFNDVGVNVNKDFSFFNLNENDINRISHFPPLSAPFGEFKSGSMSQILMTQKIGEISTQQALWVMQSQGQSKTGVLAAEGIWRWRMYDFAQNKNTDAVDAFIQKTATYLSVKHNRKQFNVELNKKIFNENEPIMIDAELLNENYELVNTPDVTLTVSDESGKKSNFVMDKSNNSYSYNLGSLSSGKYDFTGHVSFNGKSFSSGGSFQVTSQNIEEVQTTADFGLLHQLAKNYSGEFVYANQISTLKDKIKMNNKIQNIIHSEAVSEPLIEWKWLFALLFLSLAAEWFLRKRNGSY